MTVALRHERGSDVGLAGEPTTYDVHGVRIAIDGDDPSILAVIDHSYAAFRSTDDGTPALTLTMHRRGDRVRIDAGDRGHRDVPATHGLVAMLDTLVAALQRGLFARGILPIHAGVVVGPSGAILIAGPSGAGKSTQVLGLLRRGLAFATDELALVGPDDRAVLPYPRAVHVRPATLAMVPELGFLTERSPIDLGGGNEWSAGPADLHRALGAPVAPPSPLRAIVLLDGPPNHAPDPRLQPVPAAIATMELVRGAPTAAFAYPETQRRLASIAPSVPCFRIRPGDLDATAAAIVDGVEAPAA